MEKTSYFIIIILFYHFFFVLSPIPNWDLAAQSIDLMTLTQTGSYDYILYEKTAYDIKVTLKKTIKKDSNNVISTKNYLIIGQDSREVNFEDIDSHYKDKMGYNILICPKGKFHPYNFNEQKHIDPPSGFEDRGDWDLRCYSHDKGHFFLFYLSNKGKNIYYYYNGNIASRDNFIDTYLYDYKLENGIQSQSNYNYKFATLRYVTYKNGTSYFRFSPDVFIFNTDNGDVNKNTIASVTEMILAKIHMEGSFDNNHHFRYLAYNNVSDFESGYSENYIDFSSESNYKTACNSLTISKKMNSPMNFVDNVEIELLKFIPGTKYVYYIINNLDKNKKNYGLIDLNLNKVLYNIEGEFTQFIPNPNFSEYEMLAITENSAYKLCIVKSGTTCLDPNSNTNLILDPEGNKYQSDCDSGKVKMMPEGICMDENLCDTNLYILKTVDGEKQCGLCSYFNPEGDKYKFVNIDGCISSIPANADYYNKNLNILKCKNDYHLNDGICIPDFCYETCETCSEISSNSNDQKCSSCKAGYKLDSGKNCIIIPTTVLIPPTTVILPQTTVIVPPTTFIIPPTTIMVLPTTVIKPPTTVIIPATTIIKPPTSVIILPTTVIKLPTTVIIPPTNIKKPSTTLIFPSTTVIKPPSSIIIPPTTVITTIPIKAVTTTPRIIPITSEIKCLEEKCLDCSEKSISLNLCLSCNEALGYKKVNYTLVFTEFVDCIKEKDPKLKKFYYNKTLNEYRPCYKTCKKCLKGGDAETQNCLECETNYMFRPGDNPHNNCVAYSEFYYIDSYNQYKSLNSLNCPEEAKYVIKEKKSCIYDCRKDNEYKYLYNGQCWKNCPFDTKNNSFICTEIPSKSYLGINELNLPANGELKVDDLVKTYISEFTYTNNHASLYNNEEYNILLYRNPKIINDFSLKMSKVDFKDCYELVKSAYGIQEDLIITVVDKKNINNPTSYYSFFHPKSGEKLDAENICKNEVIVVKENLTNILSEEGTKYELQSSLTNQGINIFDVNDPFYTDLCFEYKNPKKRDMPLSLRIKNIFPNVTLCNDGCQMDGINLEEMTATCNCKFNDITNNQAIKENVVLDSMLGEIFDLINSSNIFVVKCYKYIFKYFKNSIGGILTASIICLNIILSYFFFAKDFFKISEYIRSITNRYLAYLSIPFQKRINFPPKRNRIKNKTTIKKNKTLKKLIREEENSNNKNNNYSTIEIKEKVDKKNNRKNKKKNKTHKINNKNVFTSHYINEVTTEYLDENRLITKFVEEYLETSPDEMEYDDAIKKDERTFCKYFRENLKEKQIIANTFIANDPIKSRTIKIILFNLNLILYFVINGLFISEDYISEIYNLNEEEENFFSFLPRSVERLIYTTLVSLIISYITGFFFLEESKVKGIFKRDMENKTILKENINELIKTLKTRHISFIIVVFVILILSLYYLLCFNYVYPKTQIEWVKSSIAIIIIIQILSILQILLEAIIRFLSFKCESEKLFKFGKIFS